MHNSDFNILLWSVHLFPKLQIPKIHKNIQKIKGYLYNTSWVLEFVHPTVHFSFFCICNVSKYCFLFVWKANKVEVREYDMFMNDFHLCPLETARSQWVLYQDP